MTREERLARTLVELADTLVDDFDVVELLALLVDRSVELLDASAAGLVLNDDDGHLRLMASSSEAMELVELFQVQNDEGPCFDCCRSGEPVSADDLAQAADRWPAFVPVATGSGFNAAYTFPLRLRGRVLGALNAFSHDPGRLASTDIVAGQAMADVAAIALCQFWAMRDAQLVKTQLQHALDSRVVIEQAKGMLAQRAGIGVDEAFSLLRAHARTSQRLLTDVAGDVVSGALSPEVVAASPALAAEPAPGGVRAG